MTYKGEPYNAGYYKGNRAGGYTDYEGGTVEEIQRRIADDIEASFGLVDGKRIVDLGCGFGYLVDELASRGADITGLDLSQYAIDKAGALFPDRDFVLGDATNTSFSNKTFNIVIGIGLADCMPDLDTLKTLLSEVKRIMKPNGKVYALASLGGVEEYYLLLTKSEWTGHCEQKFQGKTITVDGVGHLPLGWDVRITVD